MRDAAAIILAAGKSTRMKSDLPKVLHEVCGRPMLASVIDACTEAEVTKLVVVVGHGKQLVMDAFSHNDRISWVEQSEQKGTGHAALMCKSALADFAGPTLVIAGDMPLIRGETVSTLLDQHGENGRSVTLATSIFDDPSGYGRIVRDDAGKLLRIVEEVDCSESERSIREVNISYYCFDTPKMFNALEKLTPNNKKGEYYITDAVRILIDAGYGADAIPAVPPADAMGINSRADLARVNALMQSRIQQNWMARGVTIVDTGSTWIDAKCEIGAATVIHPFTHVATGACIGEGCNIGPFASVVRGELLTPGSEVCRAAPAGVSRS